MLQFAESQGVWWGRQILPYPIAISDVASGELKYHCDAGRYVNLASIQEIPNIPYFGKAQVVDENNFVLKKP